RRAARGRSRHRRHLLPALARRARADAAAQGAGRAAVARVAAPVLAGRGRTGAARRADQAAAQRAGARRARRRAGMIRRSVALALWRSLAIACVALALLGTVLPVLPTVPFLLVAAWAGSRGWPRLETWLLE